MVIKYFRTVNMLTEHSSESNPQTTWEKIWEIEKSRNNTKKDCILFQSEQEIQENFIDLRQELNIWGSSGE